MMDSPNAHCISITFDDLFVGGLAAYMNAACYTDDAECTVLFQYILPEFRLGFLPFQMLNDSVYNWAMGRNISVIKAANFNHIVGPRLMSRIDFEPYQTIYTRSLP